MVAVPARPRPLFIAQWIVPVVVIVGSWIGMLWFLRPGAQLGIVGLVVLLAAYIVIVLTVRGPKRPLVLTVAVIALAIACVASVLVLFGVTEPIPFRIP